MRHDTAVLDFINSLAADVEDVTQLGLRDVSLPAQGPESFGNRFRHIGFVRLHVATHETYGTIGDQNCTSDSTYELRQRDAESLRKFLYLPQTRFFSSVLQFAHVAHVHADTMC